MRFIVGSVNVCLSVCVCVCLLVSLIVHDHKHPNHLHNIGSSSNEVGVCEWIFVSEPQSFGWMIKNGRSRTKRNKIWVTFGSNTNRPIQVRPLWWWWLALKLCYRNMCFKVGELKNNRKQKDLIHIMEIGAFL